MRKTIEYELTAEEIRQALDLYVDPDSELPDGAVKVYRLHSQGEDQARCELPIHRATVTYVIDPDPPKETDE